MKKIIISFLVGLSFAATGNLLIKIEYPYNIAASTLVFVIGIKLLTLITKNK